MRLVTGSGVAIGKYLGALALAVTTVGTRLAKLVCAACLTQNSSSNRNRLLPVPPVAASQPCLSNKTTTKQQFSGDSYIVL